MPHAFNLMDAHGIISADTCWIPLAVFVRWLVPSRKLPVAEPEALGFPLLKEK